MRGGWDSERMAGSWRCGCREQQLSPGWESRVLGRSNGTQHSLDDHAGEWHLTVLEVMGTWKSFHGGDVVTCEGQACVWEDELEAER